TPDARRVDSSRYVSLRSDVRARVHENVVPTAKTGPFAAREMFCDECDVALEGTGTACLQDGETASKRGGGKTADRNDCRPVEGRGIRPAAIAVPGGPTGTESGGKISRKPGGTQKIGKIVQGMRGQQENHSTTLPRRNKNDFQQVAAATSPPSCHAAARFRRESDRRGAGCRVQQHQRVHLHVPQTAGKDAGTVFEDRRRIEAPVSEGGRYPRKPKRNSSVEKRRVSSRRVQCKSGGEPRTPKAPPQRVAL